MTRTPRVKFYLEKRIDKVTKNLITNNVPVLFSVSYGSRFKSSTGIRIDEKYWDKKKQRIKSSFSNATQINKMLDNLAQELKDICYDAWDRDILITGDYISSKLRKNQHSAKGLLNHFTEFIEQGKKKWQNSTVKKFNTIKNQLTDLSEKKRVRVEYDSLTQVFLDKLLDFYFEDKKFINTHVRKNLRFIQQFLNWATEKGYNRNLAYKKWKLETGAKKELTSENIALTISEFLNIYNAKDLSESLQRARDYIVLACSTGLRYSDIANLKKADINYQQGIIRCQTIKTGEVAIIPFNDFSHEILEKYRYSHNLNRNGIELAFKIVSNQKLNEALKILAEKAGLIDNITVIHYQRTTRIEDVIPKYKLISTHIGRKTFITFNVWLGVQSEITMGMTTHSSHDMLEKYYSVNLDMKRQAMSMFNLENLTNKAKQAIN
jgi:integrase